MINTIVVDTSVLISALIRKEGASRAVLRGCLEGRFDPVISNALFLEYEDVSQRPNLIDACPLTDKEIRELLNAFYSVCRWVQIYYLWRPNLPDEEDNFLIELALAGNAQAIITHNVKDFQNAELKFPGLSILTPAQFLRGE
ncbi:MAG: putative toxin-antitoxin system toxin component, PIN family [Chloroflexi bacterium]|nr:MAG: putative toxin-antitoxin system toxin component, PIN family [Chloroflexota bacterium]